ncbi:MAG TPA: SDR family oxidoreductase, partial [Bryobacteraceae bacterium]|nr:SDR family oxidoreductase [Bryobacteraceae bacterium]
MEFARCGADVAFCDVCEPELAEATLSATRQTGQSARYFRTSVADRRELELLFKDLLDEFGRLDILVNNAAYQEHVPDIDHLTDEHFDRTLQTMAREAAKHIP